MIIIYYNIRIYIFFKIDFENMHEFDSKIFHTRNTFVIVFGTDR